MTLPFQKSDGKRRFQCFICGIDHTSIEEFVAHILSEHEEGREYVKCPLARCQMPVRDLAGHFLARHPTEKLPSNCGMLRAIVWKDHGRKKGQAGPKKPNFREGTFVSMKMHGKEMHYRSGWECEVYECLEVLSDVAAYWVEPVRIPYLHEGRMHDYLPDIRIQLTDGSVELWEIKPSEQTVLKKNKDKWRSAKAWCSARNWRFVVMTQKRIGQLKRKVIGEQRGE